MSWQMLLAPIGVALLVFLSWRLGGWRRAALRDEAQACEVFGRDYPEKTASDVLISQDGGSALLSLGDTELGLITVNGDRFVTRALSRDNVRDAAFEPQVWTLRLRDFAVPHVTVRLPEDADRMKWQARIERLVKP